MRSILWLVIILVAGDVSFGQVQDYTLIADITYAEGVPKDERTLDIYIPNSIGDNLPVMLYVHGGSWRLGDKSNTAFKDEFFTNLGYVFVSINYRLSPNPIDLSDSTRVKHPDHIMDVAQAIRWVHDNINTYKGDPDRLSIIGHSAGAHLTALVAIDNKYLEAEDLSIDVIKCACALDAGAYDIPYMFDNYLTAGSNLYNTYINAFGDDRDNWEDASPMYHINNNAANIPPFLLVHQGTNQRVDIANRFANRLIDNQVDAYALNASPLDHEEINKAIGSSDELLRMYNDTIAHFFDQCLKDLTTTTNKQYQPSYRMIYPNPTSDFISIKSLANNPDELLEIMLYDLNGNLLSHTTSNAEIISIDIRDYPNGNYSVRLQTDTWFGSYNIIKI